MLNTQTASMSCVLSGQDIQELTNILEKKNPVFLCLEHCGMRSILTLQYYPLLVALDLSYNNIRELNYESFWNITRNLVYLDLSGNRISAAAQIQNLKQLKKLVFISLQHNLIKRTDYLKQTQKMLPQIIGVDNIVLSTLNLFDFGYRLDQSTYVKKQRQIDLKMEFKYSFDQTLANLSQFLSHLIKKQSYSCPILIIQKHIRALQARMRFNFIKQNGNQKRVWLCKYFRKRVLFARTSQIIRAGVMRKMTALIVIKKAFSHQILQKKRKEKIIHNLKLTQIQIAIKHNYIRNLTIRTALPFRDNPFELDLCYAVSYTGSQKAAELFKLLCQIIMVTVTTQVLDNVNYSGKTLSDLSFQMFNTNYQYAASSKRYESSHIFFQTCFSTTVKREREAVTNTPYFVRAHVSNKELSCVMFYLFVKFQMTEPKNKQEKTAFRFGELIVEERMARMDKMIVQNLFEQHTPPLSILERGDERMKFVIVSSDYLRFTASIIQIQRLIRAKKARYLFAIQLENRGFQATSMRALAVLNRVAKIIQKKYRMIRGERQALLLAKGLHNFQSAIKYGIILFTDETYRSLLYCQLKPQIEFKKTHCSLSDPVCQKEGFRLFQTESGNEYIETYNAQFLSSQSCKRQLIVLSQISSSMYSKFTSCFFANQKMKQEAFLSVDCGDMSFPFNSKLLSKQLRNNEQCQNCTVKIKSNMTGRKIEDDIVHAAARSLCGLQENHKEEPMDVILQQLDFSILPYQIDYKKIQLSLIDQTDSYQFDVNQCPFIPKVFKRILKVYLQNKKYRCVHSINGVFNQDIGIKALLIDTMFTDITKIRYRSRNFIGMRAELISSDVGSFSIDSLLLLASAIVLQKFVRSFTARKKFKQLRSQTSLAFKIGLLQQEKDVTIFDDVAMAGKEMAGASLIQLTRKQNLPTQQKIDDGYEIMKLKDDVYNESKINESNRQQVERIVQKSTQQLRKQRQFWESRIKKEVVLAVSNHIKTPVTNIRMRIAADKNSFKTLFFNTKKMKKRIFELPKPSTPKTYDMSEPKHNIILPKLSQLSVKLSHPKLYDVSRVKSQRIQLTNNIAKNIIQKAMFSRAKSLK